MGSLGGYSVLVGNGVQKLDQTGFVDVISTDAGSHCSGTLTFELRTPPSTHLASSPSGLVSMRDLLGKALHN